MDSFLVLKKGVVHTLILGGESMSIGMIGLLGFLAEGFGLGMGILLLYIFNIKSQRKIGMLFGGTSGLMIAMICFDVLPEALESQRIDLVIIGICIGVTIGLLLDDVSPIIQERVKKKGKTISMTAIALTIGIALHNIPEGFALGTLGNASIESIGQFTFILALHSIPEGIALAIPFKEAQMRLSVVMIIPLILGFLMAGGTLLGYLISGINTNCIITALGLATGIILYIVCQELLPESRKIWNGRMTSVATIIGIMLGLLLLQH